MSVDLTQDELNIFSKNGISEDDIKNTVNAYRSEGLSDEEIRGKVDTKLASYNKKPTLRERFNNFVAENDKKVEQMNEDVKQRARDNLQKRAEWEEKHPFISGFQKDYQPSLFGQPSYRGKVPQWELQAKYGLNAPMGEQLKTDLKTFGLDAVAPVNIGVDVATGGEGAVAKQGLKQLIKNGIKQGAKTGAIGGVTQGITSSLADNGISTDLIKRPLEYGGLGAIFGSIFGGGSAYLSNKLEPLFKGIKTKLNIGNKLPKNVKTEVYGEIVTPKEEWGGTVGADIPKNTTPKNTYQKPNEYVYKKDLEQVLGLTEDNWDQEPNFYSKEMENEAYAILSQATGKSINWLRSQLKGGNGKGMAKRREFIEMLLEHTDDKLNNFTAGENDFYNLKSVNYENKGANSDQVGLGQEISQRAYDDAINGNFNWDTRDALTKATDTADIEYKKIMRELIDGDGSQATYENATSKFESIIKDLPDDMQEDYWNKFFSDMEKAENMHTSNRMRENGDLKKSSLAQTADLPPEMRKAVQDSPPEYEVLHNEDLIANAQLEIEKNPSSRLARLDNMANGKDPLSAQDFEEARQLVGQLYKEGRIDEALNLTQKISQAGSRAGQSVQAMSLWAKTTPEGAVRQAQKIIDEYNKNARKKIPDLTEEQAKEIIEMAEEIQRLSSNTGSREKDVATAKMMKYFVDLVPQSNGNKLKTLRNISLLLNPKTFMRNITGNAIFSAMENGITKPLASGLDKLASKFTGKRTRVMPQYKDYIGGLAQGTKEGIEDVNLGIDTRGIGGRFDLPQGRSFEDVPVLGQLEKALDFSLRVPDRSFYQATFNESLANQMLASGVDKPTNEMLENASKEALESVYQNDGKLAHTVLNMRNGLNSFGIKNFGAGDVLIPYAQTPANVTQQGINYSPLGIVNAIKSGLQGDQRQATLDLARAITGSGIIGGSYALAKNGGFTPDFENYQVRKNYEAEGVRPNTIKLPNGSNMSYTQLQPLSAPISAGAIMGNLQDGDYMSALDKGISSVTDLSMLRGVNDFVDTYNDKGLGSAIANTVLNIPSQFIGSWVNQINAYVDPIQRETYDPNPLIQGLNQARAKMPLISKTLPKKYDVTGQEIPKYQSKGVAKAYDVFVNPVFINKPKDDIVVNEVTALLEETGEKDGLFTLPEKKIKLDDGTTKQLSGKEFSEYSKTLGEVTYQGYEKMMNTPRYQNADDQTRLKLLGDIRRNAKAITQAELFGKANKYSVDGKIDRKVQNRLNKGQNKINRILSKMDSQLVDSIMYEE